ncbi:hypothetical protein Cni_G18184 [Canna indica]|uniref:Uncharacterized protein n=1 Tax=Canna indica TaxID=4628 RepID=A0AAQ3KP08_9LILI|nr:hypothetical protein Cni_G18184 [Canna indica]
MADFSNKQTTRTFMERKCTRHPEKQSPGVCSYCLTERLSRLSAASSTISSPGRSSSASDFSSAFPSPPPRSIKQSPSLAASMFGGHKGKDRKKWSFWSMVKSGLHRRREVVGGNCALQS